MGLVRKSATSVKDLRSIWDYVAGESGPDRADGLLRTLNDQIQFLSDTPGAGRARPELRRRLRSLPVGKYLIFYRRARGGIYLVRVLHGARDLRRLFRR